MEYEAVSKAAATVHVQAEVKNDHYDSRKTQVRLTLSDAQGKQIAQALSPAVRVDKGQYGTASQLLHVTNPRLWSPEDPYRYRLLVGVLHGVQLPTSKANRSASVRFNLHRKAFSSTAASLGSEGPTATRNIPILVTLYRTPSTVMPGKSKRRALISCVFRIIRKPPPFLMPATNSACW